MSQYPGGLRQSKEADNECAIQSTSTEVNYQIVNAESLEFGIAGLRKKKKNLVCESESLT